MARGFGVCILGLFCLDVVVCYSPVDAFWIFGVGRLRCDWVVFGFGGFFFRRIPQIGGYG